jgi:hypothetical protein
VCNLSNRKDDRRDGLPYLRRAFISIHVFRVERCVRGSLRPHRRRCIASCAVCIGRYRDNVRTTTDVRQAEAKRSRDRWLAEDRASRAPSEVQISISH